MEILVNIFWVIPLLGYIISLLFQSKNEKALSISAITTFVFQLLSLVVFTILFFVKDLKFVNLNDFTLYSGHGYKFYIDIFFDEISAVYGLVGALLGLLIALFSRRYLHREEGYKRFFNTLLFFYFGYNVAIFAGNFETLFVGWEVLGISSFLLIAFYRERYLPVKNALKVFFLYRIGDVGMILAMWLSHHLWHSNISFARLQNAEIVHHQILNHSFEGIIVALFLFLSSMIKSSAWPFSSWLPRAMEGPTPSSAIFYGSLSVHLGAFVMLRTYPLYEFQPFVIVFIVFVGLVTSWIGFQASRVQSSIKTQIAYGSVSQIGLIFVEIALGWHILALIHFAGNAFLRTYQLLISPSVAVYSIRHQQFEGVKDRKVLSGKLLKIRNTILTLGIKEFYMEEIQYNLLWKPLKFLGKKLKIINYNTLFIFIPIVGITVNYAFLNFTFKTSYSQIWSMFFGAMALVSVLKSFAEYNETYKAWWAIFFSHLFVVFAVNVIHPGLFFDSILYLSGAFVSALLGFVVLRLIKVNTNMIDLSSFRGNIKNFSVLGFLFLISALGISGFPITPTFIGEDLIFSHITESEFVLAFFVAITFIVNGLSAIRMYARLFLVDSLVYFRKKYKTA